MPRGDRTGPYGDGPRTGRAMGFCSGYNSPGYLNNPGGPGFRNAGYAGGPGRARGHRNMFYSTGMPGWMRWRAPETSYVNPAPQLTKQDEKNYLQAQAEQFNRVIEDINKML